MALEISNQERTMTNKALNRLTANGLQEENLSNEGKN